MTPSEKLIVFTRYPEPGRTKTRLIPALGPQGAADLQRRLAERVVAQARLLCQGRGTDLEVHYAGGDPDKMAAWLGKDLAFRPQRGEGLGRRLAAAFEAAFEPGVAAAVLIGTDVIDLSASVLERAFEALERAEVVLGPAADGGYYLIGLKRPLPELFTDIPWSTDRTAEVTLKRAREMNLAVALVDELADVDRPPDLAAIRDKLGSG